MSRKGDDEFWVFAARLLDLATVKMRAAPDSDTARWRFDIPVAFWEAAKRNVAELTDHPIRDDPPTPQSAGFYRLFGYPFAVDPDLRPNELRLTIR